MNSIESFPHFLRKRVARSRRGLALAVCVALTAALAPASYAQEQAQERYALVIGIDEYSAEAQKAAEQTSEDASRGSVREWTDLDGAVRDAEMIHALLTTRFGFEEDNTRLLLNGEATRAGILGALQDLIDDENVGQGDAVFFHYSGHGSQVKNTETDERDGMDETIVPAPSGNGPSDIRDKELRTPFNALLAKGVELTLIFDSCNSGSITRGLAPPKTRALKPSDRVISESDAGLPPPVQEHPAALVLSAAQDRQEAQEMRTPEEGESRGAFSWALMEVLNSSPEGAPARQIFDRTRALMRSHASGQEPVLAGSSSRRGRPLFGGAASENSSATVAALEVQGRSVTLQGGRAMGLRRGAELCAAPTEAGAPVDTTAGPCLRIERVRGLSRAEARVTKGTAGDIAPSDLFVVTRWVPGQAPLRFWMPPALPDADAVASAEAALRSLRQNATKAPASVTWIEDPTRTTPTHVISYRADGWHLLGPDNTDTPLGPTPDAERAASVLADAERAAVYVQLPPTQPLAGALRRAVAAEQGALEFADAPEEAHYHLTGRYEATVGGTVRYGWTYRPATQALDNAPMMPAQTDAVELTAKPDDDATRLASLAQQLGRVWGWLELKNPTGSASAFPFEITGFEDVDTGTRVAAGDTLRWGYYYRAVIEADPAALARAHRAAEGGASPERYLYLFLIGQDGSGTLLYPSAGYGGTENEINFFDAPEAKQLMPRTGPPIVMFDGDGNGEPDVDTFVLLSSAQPLPNADVLFNFSPVRSRSKGEEPPEGNALAKMLFERGEGTRGGGRGVPTDWSIQRVPMASAAAR